MPHTTSIHVEYRRTADLIPYSRILRRNTHDRAVERMMASILEFGFKIPVLARSNGEVVDGQLRLKAARKLGIEEVPVILCDEWTEAQVKAFRLLVNRSASWATWNPELVALEISELKALNFDLSLTGFDRPEIDRFLFGTGASGEDIPLESTSEAITRPGDQWNCGGHRVRCGDATSPEVVNALLAETKPVLLVSDPPYGTLTDPQWRERAGLGRQRQTGLVANDDRADWTAAYKLFPGNVAYIWHAGVHAAEVARGLEAAGFTIRAQIIWAKQHFAMSRGDYHWQHEPCWYAVRNGASSNWSGDRKQSTLWEIPNLNPFGGNREEEATGHGTQKPIELMRRSILNNSKPGDIVYDPFIGSGSTLNAAALTDRVCYGLDIDPRYVDMAVLRWQRVSGKPATLEGDGRTFGEISAERRAVFAEEG